MPFLPKNQLSKGFYGSVNHKLQKKKKKIVVYVESNTQLLENFPHVGDMLLCLYKYLHNLNKLGKRRKHKQNCGTKDSNSYHKTVSISKK